MKLCSKPLTPTQARWFYTDASLDNKRGTVGHMKLRPAPTWNEQIASWYPHQEALICPAFQKNFDRVMSMLCLGNGPLGSVERMKRFCAILGQSAVIDKAGSVGIAIETDTHQFMVRMSPKKELCHIYCYDKEAQMQYQQQMQTPEQAFFQSEDNCYAIYQLKRTPETAQVRFSSLDLLNKWGLTPNYEHYDMVYIAQLPSNSRYDQNTILEGLYTQFNVNHPTDFTGHSLSVSDIVALKQGGVVSFHYCDSIGFKELNEFLPQQKKPSLLAQLQQGETEPPLTQLSKKRDSIER